ncbi:MAG: hypothetical protein HY565_00610, partial [Candidatus Kerfeldbacteria bacterium]|nr:hypothetical protein [Candidatus Kerfeldbacteria bacterium]
MVMQYSLIALGIALALPGLAAEEINMVDSATAALVSDDLRTLVVDPTTDHVLEPMLPYHLQGVLDSTTRNTVHTLGMIGLYNDATTLDSIVATLEETFAERSPILQSGGLTLTRDLTGLGFWEIHESTPGTYRFDLTDPIVTSASSYGVNHLVVIQPYALWDQLTAGYTADSDNDHLYNGGDFFVLKENTGPGVASDLSRYRSFLQALQAEYANIQYYEIGNEIDNAATGYGAAPLNYATLVASTRTALGDDVQLLNGGTTDINYTYWNSFFDAGGGDDIDVFNVHYNNEKTTVQSSFAQFEMILDNYN